MFRKLRILPFLVLAIWSAVLIGRGVWRAPEFATALFDARPALDTLRHADRYHGTFHRFLDEVEPLIPPDAPTFLVGPLERAWAGHRSNHYKLYRYRMTPRPVRPARSWDDMPDLYAWADYIVIFRSSEPQSVPGEFELIARPLGEGRVYRRRGAP